MPVTPYRNLHPYPVVMDEADGLMPDAAAMDVDWTDTHFGPWVEFMLTV